MGGGRLSGNVNIVRRGWRKIAWKRKIFLDVGGVGLFET